MNTWQAQNDRHPADGLFASVKARFTKPVATWVASLLLLIPLSIRGHTNLEDAYSALGFDPRTSSNAVVVVLSDPHMFVDPNWAWMLTSELDPRLVGIINAMDPAPAKIIVSGDTSTTIAPIPGWIPRQWSMDYGTNEMSRWLRAITAITNTLATNIVWVPGNHDQLDSETNAESFRLMYPMMPTRQRLDVAGIRFFLLNCGNYGGRNPDQMAWLQQEVAHTPTRMPIAVVTHIPPFVAPPIWRGNALDLRKR